MSDRCAAHSRKGHQCKMLAIPGATVCRYHGGLAPQVKQAAERRVQRQQAEQAVIRFDLRRDIGPHEALLESVQTSAALVGEYAAVVAQIDHDRLVHGVVKTVQLPDGSRRVEAAAARSVWLDLYNEERDRLVKACATAVSCGVAKREVELRENQARVLAEVISLILTDLGHDLTEPRTREVVRLRLLEGGRQNVA